MSGYKINKPTIPPSGKDRRHSILESALLNPDDDCSCSLSDRKATGAPSVHHKNLDVKNLALFAQLTISLKRGIKILQPRYTVVFIYRLSQWRIELFLKMLILFCTVYAFLYAEKPSILMTQSSDLRETKDMLKITGQSAEYMHSHWSVDQTVCVKYCRW